MKGSAQLSCCSGQTQEALKLMAQIARESEALSQGLLKVYFGV